MAITKKGQYFFASRPIKNSCARNMYTLKKKEIKKSETFRNNKLKRRFL